MEVNANYLDEAIHKLKECRDNYVVMLRITENHSYMLDPKKLCKEGIKHLDEILGLLNKAIDKTIDKEV